MANVYRDFRDDIIKREMDTMHNRLKNPGGIKPLGFRDRARPSLDYPQGATVKIKGVEESHKRLNLDGTLKK